MIKEIAYMGAQNVLDGIQYLAVDGDTTGGTNNGPLGNIDDVSTAAQMPPGFEQVAAVLGWARWGAMIVCVGALIGFFGHLAMERQSGGGNGSIGWLGKILIAVIGISAAVSLIGFFIN
jgi:hypothetical protein